MESLELKAKMKKDVKELPRLLADLGFTKMDSRKDVLRIEKSEGESLSGKLYIHYAIIFSKDSIKLEYTLPPNKSKNKRLLEILPVFLNVLILVKGHYQYDATELNEAVSNLLKEIGPIIDMSNLELSSQFDELKKRYSDLENKYADLLRSSEENARILLELERRKNELEKRVGKLHELSDESLKEEIYKWIRVHGGRMNIEEFSVHYSVPLTRVEEGLDMLIREGYIQKR